MTQPDRLTILIVDDDPEVRSLLCEVLDREGLRAVAATDADDIVQLAIQRRPALIVLDIVMRQADGYSIAAALRRHALTREIPIIFVTGEEAPVYRTVSDSLGAAAHFTKPISPHQLTETINRVLGRMA